MHKLSKRLAALEQHQIADNAALAGAVAEFDRRFLRLVEHYQGRDPGPAASLAAQCAAEVWHDPDALAAIRARAATIARAAL